MRASSSRERDHHGREYRASAGRFHTSVSDGPIFSRPVRVGREEVVIRASRFGSCDLTFAVGNTEFTMLRTGPE